MGVMTDKQIDKHIPRLRFHEFQNEGAWNESLFGDLFMFLPNNTLSRAELKEGKGDVYNVHYGDVLIKLNAYTDIQQGKLPAIKNVNDISKYQYARLQDGDIVIADTAEDETVGKCTEIGNTKETVVVSGLHTIPCRPKMKFAQAFLGYYMNSSSFHNKLRPIMQGVKVTSISKSALQNIYLSFPKSLEEQHKIADCLSSIDSYISSINEKIEQLKAHKKSLLQKLFPQNGKTVPEYRFPEFEKDGAWGKEAMENIFEIRNGYTPSKSNPQFWEGGTIPWFRMEDIRKNGHILSDAIQHVTPSAVKGKGLFPAYSIILATTATIGEHALIIVDSLANQQFTFLTKRESFDSKLDMLYFHYYMFIIDEWCKQNTNSGGLLSVNMPAFKQLMVPYPQPTEQKKIAECFSSIDKTIISYAQKTSLLKQQKTGLIQQLFPTI